MAPKLNWKPNVKKRCSKALKAFYFLKRNTPTSTKLSAKLNLYARYVVPIVTYATHAWFANKTETKDIERVQKKANSWILNNWELNYKKRLGKLNVLPLSLYIELHDLLLLIAFLSGNYNINILINRNQNCDDQPNFRQFELININQTRTEKADENFWRRSSQRLNIIYKITTLAIENLSKKRLTELYWIYFSRQYSEANSCTWTFLCNCNNCNPVQKVKLANQ